MLDAFKEIDLRRNIAVQRAAEVLNAPSLMVLAEALMKPGVKHPDMKTMAQVLGNSARVAAIDRLLEMGALRAKYLQVTPDLLSDSATPQDAHLVQYECSEFGLAVVRQAGVRMGLASPDIREALERAIEAQKS